MRIEVDGVLRGPPGIFRPTRVVQRSRQVGIENGIVGSKNDRLFPFGDGLFILLVLCIDCAQERMGDRQSVVQSSACCSRVRACSRT